MPAVGLLTLELRIEDARSLKDKRHVVKGLKDRLRHRFNVSVAEIDGQDTWQRSTLAIVAVSKDRPYAESLLITVEQDAANFLGGSLVDAFLDWLS